MAVADYTVQDVKGIKKSFDNASRLTIEKYQNVPIFDIQVTDEYSEIFTSTEGMSGVIQLGEEQTPPTLKLEDGYSITLTSERFGAAIQVTSTDQVKMGDSTVKVRQFLTRQRDQILRTLKYKFLTQIHLMLNEAHDSTSDYLAPDGVELCGAHTWATGTTFDNSATAALDSAAVDTAMEFGGAFTSADGKQMPQTYDTIVVKLGSAAARTAKKLFAEGITPTAVDDINIYEGEFTIIETPMITTANKLYWFMFDLSTYPTPLHAGITKMPRMEAPIVQNNGAVRSNVEGFWNQGINNIPFNVYGSTGAT